MPTRREAHGLMTLPSHGWCAGYFRRIAHMTVHSLTKSAIFFTVGHAAQKSGTQVMDNIRGLIDSNPTIGWGLMLGSLRSSGHSARSACSRANS